MLRVHGGNKYVGILMNIELLLVSTVMVFFFFQAEDGIRDHCVTGVQTCALPICTIGGESSTTDSRISSLVQPEQWPAGQPEAASTKIGRASCRERV